MAVLRADHYAVQRGERLLQLQPRQSAPARRVQARGIFDHDSFIVPSASRLERRLNLLSRTGFADFCDPELAGELQLLQSMTPLGQRTVQQGFSVKPKQVEHNEFHGHFFAEK